MLPKPHRLHRGPLLNAAFKAGRRLRIATTGSASERYVDIILLYAKPSPDVAASRQTPRFCFIVSKKVSNRANKRNKIRRRIREIIRTELIQNPVALEKLQNQAVRAVLIIARPNVLDATYQQLKSQVVHSIIKG